MAVKFKETVKHQGIALAAGISTSFEAKRADDYFIAAGWAEATDEEPVIHYSQDQISIDAKTVHAQTTKRVLADEKEA